MNEKPSRPRLRLALTGGRGRLAQLAARFFKTQGYEVVLFSTKAGDEFEPLEKLLTTHTMASFDAIFHFAWSSVPFTSESHPGCEEKNDFPLLKKLLKNLMLAAAEGKAPKFIFPSSASVYGNQMSEKATEQTPCNPLGAYARGKQHAEEIIMEVAEKHPFLEMIILRITNVIGFPSDPRRPQGILPRIIAAAQEQQPLEIWGNGHCDKDYLWSDDFLAALQDALRNPIKGIFNIASGKNFSILDFLSAVEKAAGVPISVHYKDRYSWDVTKCRVDSSLFSQTTGWSAKADIIKNIKEQVL